MNKVFLLGRLTAKPELRYTPSNTAYSRFSVAVNRRVARQDGTRETDFINCTAWGKTAENIARFFDKGNQICIDGSIRTGSYTAQDGTKRYTTDVNVDNFDFVDKKGNNEGGFVPSGASETPYDFATSSPTPANQSTMNADTPANNDPFAEFGESVSIDDNFLD